MASMRESADGFIYVDEFRDNPKHEGQVIDNVVTRGTFTLVLVFHPNYVKSYQVTCEGLGKWRGQPAWLIRFEQSS